ncbi:MAG: hypothetical protein K9J16_16900 [Melioribacteraceae bacterium]|nr:hypothetical protein [Melioribacteraceae bacterium]MCF8356514.1 hypothetical protein [Melioribacteraceae bacterium]MCF8396124.1 hypothetical protein [Melioribacteraceae bacterium]MCF8420957.1 hypothetical protein [Melioribacteraceae bacterium]
MKYQQKTKKRLIQEPNEIISQNENLNKHERNNQSLNKDEIIFEGELSEHIEEFGKRKKR